MGVPGSLSGSTPSLRLMVMAATLPSPARAGAPYPRLFSDVCQTLPHISGRFRGSPVGSRPASLSVSLRLFSLGAACTASRTASRTCSRGVVSARIGVHLHPKTPINTVFIADLGDLRVGFIPARGSCSSTARSLSMTRVHRPTRRRCSTAYWPTARAAARAPSAAPSPSSSHAASAVIVAPAAAALAA